MLTFDRKHSYTPIHDIGGDQTMSVDAVARIDAIRSRLDGDGRVRVTALAEELRVSEVTIRRDLDSLVNAGVAQRVHGGAVRVGPQAFVDRFEQRGRAKRVIADKLRHLVPVHGNVGLDASTTVQRLMVLLGDATDLIVVTNGIETFTAAPRRPGLRTVLTGGVANEATGSLVGPLAETGARQHVLDTFICSAAAVDPTLGSTEAVLEEAAVKRAFAGVSNRVVLAVDSTKLGSTASARAFTLDEIDILVTELDPADHRLDPYRERVELR